MSINYFFASSDFDAKGFKNSASSFINYFDKPKEFYNCSIAIKSIYCENTEKIKDKLRPIIICSNLTEYIEINNTQMPILKVIYPKENWTKTLNQEFDNLEYYNVNVPFSQVIKVDLLDKNFITFDIIDGKIWLTLAVEGVKFPG